MNGELPLNEILGALITEVSRLNANPETDALSEASLTLKVCVTQVIRVPEAVGRAPCETESNDCPKLLVSPVLANDLADNLTVRLKLHFTSGNRTETLVTKQTETVAPHCFTQVTEENGYV